MEATFVIRPGGSIEFIYTDALAPLLQLGSAQVTRASHVEPDGTGAGWTADMAPIGGPVLGPYALRSEALQAEIAWIETHHFHI
jgi:hypothetical protein